MFYQKLLISLVIVLLSTSVVYATSQSIVRYDVNGDGKVDISDLILVGRNFGKYGEDIEGDVNGDGVVDISDLVLVGKHFGESVTPAVEEDTEPPTIVRSNPKDGARDVDPDDLYADGITIEFDDKMDVMKTREINIVIHGEVINWVRKWSADKKTVTLEYMKGRDIPYGIVVEIRIQAIDDAGNEAELSISFTTEEVEVGVRRENFVGMWLFNEGKGDIAKDASGNGNDGISQRNVMWVAGKFGTALVFDGLNAMVEIPNSPTLNITQSITMVAWIFPHEVKGLIVGKEGAYGMALADGVIKWVIWGDEFLLPLNIIRTREWFHIALVHDFTAKKRLICLDGELIAEKNTSVTIPISNHPLTIGKWATSGEAFDGVIDEVCIWNTALDENEVREVMRKGCLPNIE